MCDQNVRIRLEIRGNSHSCFRLIPSQLKVGELVTLDKEILHEVLAIKREGTNYRIALKSYKTINFNENEVITQIDGGWYLD